MIGLTHIRLWLSLALFTGLLIACEQQRYLIVVINNSSQDIKDVTLWLGDHSFEFGVINQYSKQTGIFQQQRLTSQIILTWRDNSNNTFEQELNTFDIVPSNYAAGRVHLTYHENNSFKLSFDETGF